MSDGRTHRSRRLPVPRSRDRCVRRRRLAGPGETLAATIRRDGERLHVAFRGEFDRIAAPWGDEVLRAVDDGRDVLVDLTGLEFIDAGGLRVLLAAHRRLGARLTLRRARASVHRIFEVTGTDVVLPFTG